jgi:hypothetical protein
MGQWEMQGMAGNALREGGEGGKGGERTSALPPSSSKRSYSSASSPGARPDASSWLICERSPVRKGVCA